MPEPLKNYLNKEFLDEFVLDLKQVYPKFDGTKFLDKVLDSDWKNKELKQRIRHIAIGLESCLEGNYKDKIKLIIALAAMLIKDKKYQYGLGYMVLPDFVEVFGRDDYNTSIKAIENITQLTSCEFAIRPFIIDSPDKVMKQMLKWSKHKNLNVRRLSSEGCRPRLPWAMALPHLKKDPGPIFPILENLKDDPSDFVRKSVANNLNDISKDNPDLVIAIAIKWKGNNKNRDWIVKHACRTLLKQGNPIVMQLFGFGSIEKIEVNGFQVLTPKVKIGEYLEFSFQLRNKAKKPNLIRLEYAMYYKKANGKLSKKVFSISEKSYAGNSITKIDRKQSFKLITTRKYYKGLHKVSLILNGNELESYDFEVI